MEKNSDFLITSFKINDCPHQKGIILRRNYMTSTLKYFYTNSAAIANMILILKGVITVKFRSLIRPCLLVSSLALSMTKSGCKIVSLGTVKYGLNKITTSFSVPINR